MNFYLINNTQWPVSEKFVEQLLRRIALELPQHQGDLKRQLGVVVSSLPQMIDLNSKFRNKNKGTDVLSFESQGEMLGDVVICYEIMTQQAKDHGLDDAEEFAYLLLHGVLHLLGYDHETNKSDALKMFAIQDKIFEILMDEDIYKSFRDFAAPKRGKKKAKKAQKQAPRKLVKKPAAKKKLRRKNG